MSSTTTTEKRYCPNCAGTITLEDLDKGYCPQCIKPLPAMMISLPSEPPELAPTSSWSPSSSTARDDQELATGAHPLPESVRLPKDEVIGWGTVHCGLLMVLIGGASAVVGYLLLAIFESVGAMGNAGTERVLRTVFGSLLTFGFFTSLMGYFLTLATPTGGARAWGLGLSVLLCFVLLAILLGTLAESPGSLPIPDPSVMEGTATTDAWILRYGMAVLSIFFVGCLGLYGYTLTSFLYMTPQSRGYLGLMLAATVLLIGYFVIEDLVIRDVLGMNKNVLGWIGLIIFSGLYLGFLALILVTRKGLTRAITR